MTQLHRISTVVILRYVVLFVDINECDNTTACHDNATCTNTEGSYSCVCKEGYTGNGTVCIGINDFPLKYKCIKVLSLFLLLKLIVFKNDCAYTV